MNDVRSDTTIGPQERGVDPFSPDRRLLYRDYIVLCTAADGSIEADPHGLYDHDTRILSRWSLTIDGVRPRLVSILERSAAERLVILRHPIRGGRAAGPRLPQDAIQVDVTTRVGRGMWEQITLTNWGAEPSRVMASIEIDADFADIQEVGRDRRQHGECTTTQDANGFEVIYRARAGDRRVERGLRVEASVAPRIDRSEPARLSWQVDLEPRGSWSVELALASLVDGEWRSPRPGDHHRAERQPTIASDPPVLGAIVDRAIADLADLRNRDLPADSDDAWVPNAGVPMYTGIFGRDILTTGWQSVLAGTAIARGAVEVIASHQAERDDPFRDAEPGKLLHEMRRGPLSELDVIPQRAYYGSQTTPAMFVLALSEMWHWTGDTEFLRRHRDVAERALRWCAELGDRDGDGFLESLSRSPRGLQNQAWKDSDEAIRYPDGRNVEPPLATVEEQAFHIVALERMAEILTALEADDEAEATLRRADDLRRRWHDAYWMPDHEFYALALDAEKQPVASIASNAGHALGAGIVPPAVARRVADRLLADDMFSGWGVRTLSADHPSYNPFAYHLGTVWPVEQATFALGFKRYGLEGHAERLVEGTLAAAAAFRDLCLPEVISGLPRSDTGKPVPYPEANCPQAWTASATIQLLQVLLGIYPFAPLRILALVQPRLPPSIRTVTIRDMTVGDALVSLRFEREPDGRARHEVIDQRGRLLILEAPPPQDVDALGPLDAVKAWAIEHAPGREARALRIALGLERTG